MTRPVELARRLAKEIPYGIVLDQYANTANPLAHYYGTAVEIVDDIKSTVKARSVLDKFAQGLADTLPAALTNGINDHTNGNGHLTSNGVNGHTNGYNSVSQPVTPMPEEAKQERSSSGQVDLLVAGAGTGGSISGISKKLKETWPGETGTKVLGIDPVGSLLALPATLNDLKKGESSKYAVEGIGECPDPSAELRL